MRSAQVLCIGSALIALSACGSVRDSLGLSKNAPDEFAVVTKAPLVMPPDYTLRPPQPGAPATRDPSASEQARQALLGSAASGTETQGQQDLLNKAGAAQADPDIRAKVEGENREISQKSQAFADQILFWQQSNAVPAAEPAAAQAQLEPSATPSALPGDPQAPQPAPAEQTATTQTPAPQPASVPQEEEGWFDWF
jgi:hypothetical protein